MNPKWDINWTWGTFAQLLVGTVERSHSPNTKQVRSLEIKGGSLTASQIFSRLRLAENFLGAFGRSHQRGQDG
ncbi:hypothetical protein H6F50_09780 [Coleofasciculus sp. FACHB-712]|nr:hypothetical protein [Coleofasciculus sp. FACHB-712]